MQTHAEWEPRVEFFRGGWGGVGLLLKAGELLSVFLFQLCATFLVLQLCKDSGEAEENPSWRGGGFTCAVLNRF